VVEPGDHIVAELALRDRVQAGPGN